MATNHDDELNQRASDDLVFQPRVNLIACKHCRVYVWSDEVGTHLATSPKPDNEIHHPYYSPKDAAAVQALVGSGRLFSGALPRTKTRRLPECIYAGNMAPLPDIRVHDDGLKCPECVFCFHQVSTLRKHYSKEHKECEPLQSRFHSGQACQQLFRGRNWSSLFAVQAPVHSNATEAQSNKDNEPPSHLGQHTDEETIDSTTFGASTEAEKRFLAALLKDWEICAAIKKSQGQYIETPSEGRQSYWHSWMGFTRVFRLVPRAVLLNYRYMKPGPKKQGRADNEQILDEAVHQLLVKLTAATNHTGDVLLRVLQKTSAAASPDKIFRTVQANSLRQYAQVWRLIARFFFHFHEDAQAEEGVVYQFTDQQRQAFQELERAIGAECVRRRALEADKQRIDPVLVEVVSIWPGLVGDLPSLT